MSVVNILGSMNTIAGFYAGLTEIAKEKKEVIINNEVSKLNILISKESDLIKKVLAADNLRIEYVGEYLKSKGIFPSETTTMNDLIRFIHDPVEKKSLSVAQHKLLSLMNEFRDLNTLNTELIKQSLAHIDYSLNALSGNMEQDFTYKNPHANAYKNDQAGSRFNSSI